MKRQRVKYAPMLLSRASEPWDDRAWSAEIKFDGWRCIADVKPTGVRLWSRHGNDLTRMFPHLQSMRNEIDGSAVLDGELCVFNDRGLPDYDRLGRRHEAVFVAFDILKRGRQMLVHKALRYSH